MGHATVLAHQGGWDEVLMVLAPIIILCVLMWVANRREQRRRGDDATTSESPYRGPGRPT